jgi:hypothetical protein
MFVRIKKIGTHEYLYLVENARESGRHAQRVIKALSRRDEVEASRLIDGLIASAARHSRRSIVLSSFYRGELPELRRLSIGPDLVFGRLWAETGCRDVLKSLVADRRFSFDVERVVYLTVLHRLMISGSDRHANDWCSQVHVPGAEGLDLDHAYHAYKAMAWLGEVDATGRSTAEAVEEALYRHRQPLFGAVYEEQEQRPYLFNLQNLSARFCVVARHTFSQCGCLCHQCSLIGSQAACRLVRCE